MGLLTITLSAATPPASTSNNRPPNIIFILADDLGLDCVSSYGADQLKTPNIDALAAGGTRFEYSYSTPLCGPSRSEILTGRYPFRTGMTSNQTGSVMKPENEVMIPKMLKSAGYVTAQVGKWSQLPLQPSDWGFDEYLRFPGSGCYWREQTPTYMENGRTKDLPEGVYLPNVMHHFLVDFLERHRQEPFYVHYAMSHVHEPIVRTPDSAPGSTTLYADNVAYMDKLVGELVAELDRLHLRESTVIIFSGDNGTARRFAPQGITVHGRPIQGDKGTMYEGGSRVPLIVNWPGVTPAGAVCHDLTDFSDFFKTISDLTGAPLPEGVTLDGTSFASQIKGDTRDPRSWIYVELDGRYYAATEAWKLNAGGDLFDMRDAPYDQIFVPRDSDNSQSAYGRGYLTAVLHDLRAGYDRRKASFGLTENEDGE